MLASLRLMAGIDKSCECRVALTRRSTNQHQRTIAGPFLKTRLALDDNAIQDLTAEELDV